MKGQEVALSVVADRFRMENCRLVSTQDTLFLGPLPSDLIGRYEGFLLDPLRRGGPMKQEFLSCTIEGTVDFIFGCGEARFENCEIRSLNDKRNIGYVAAPSHGLRQKEGFTFRNYCLTCEEGVAPGSIYLARPWRDYGMVRFENCTYGPHIATVGFDPWSGTRRDLTARFHEIPAIDGRVSWVNRE
jgi:pectinesterase